MIINLRRLRRLRAAYQRPVLYALLFLFVIDCLHLLAARPRTIRLPAASPPVNDHAPSLERRNVSVFIVSVHRNTEEILRAGWNDAIVNLVDHLGRDNVHFSAVESGSQDKTKEALMGLKGRLDAKGVPNSISLGMTVLEQLKELDDWPDPNGKRQKGWIWDYVEGHYALRRIPYLARVRNQAMEPLKALEKQGRKFDKVLWVNDVVFDTSDFLTLLHTRDGTYAAACSMDFKVYPLYYDTFALRDDRGDKAVSYYWPWFLSPKARASTRKSEPVKVESCWNGMVVFDSAPFYADPPLEFRGVDDSLADLHLEGSECCLIHADNALSADKEKGVWLNPNVRVGYNMPVYHQVQGTFPGPWATIAGAWANRWLRCRARVQFPLERWTVRRRVQEWRDVTPDGEPPRTEPGEACLINEMQIMWQNGWKHL